ncbi:hypothetical protein BC833DRAFT_554109 [Globomyces pollinis-pini]|nr:hypothetical protein BC833DRAFT_554109 [Globomyces pollinis-pini]
MKTKMKWLSLFFSYMEDSSEVDTLPDPDVVMDPAGLPNIDELIHSDHFPINDTTTYCWNIDDWATFKKSEKHHSPPFTCGNSTFRLLIFPNGNRSHDIVSVFLESVDATSKPKDDEWHVCVGFNILAVNFTTPDVYFKTSAAYHRFNSNVTDWGFSSYISSQDLVIPKPPFTRPYLENNKIKFVVYLKEFKDETGVLWSGLENWDSKAKTGYVGLKNQGATCYLNSLLQSLYFTNYFRKSVYDVPTEDVEPSKKVTYALQRLFYSMQTSDQAVGTNELTKSFGWDSMEAFHQHDVQELNRVLQDNLENSMKGTPSEGAIRKLFTGKMKSYIKCVNVNYESSRVEDYYDIQLNVKGCKNLHESFVDYCAVEMMDGDNQYRAEGFGLQDAKKGVIFNSFPPILHLQLKRFDYDFERDAFIKINDRHEFGMTLDLDPFLNPEVLNDLDPKQPKVSQRYRLQGVLVHSGDLNAGHYFALIRPKKDGPWFKFDDDKVVPVVEREILDDNFGGDTQQQIRNTGLKIKSRFFTNAYMLVYIRESDEDEMLKELTDEDVPIYLRERMKREIEEQEALQRELMERHLFMKVHIVADQFLTNYNGFDIGFVKNDGSIKSEPAYRTLKVRKDTKIGGLVENISEILKVTPEQIRLWSLTVRQNKTCRIDSIIRPETYTELSIHDFASKIKSDDELKLYVEVSAEVHGTALGKPIYFPLSANPESILIFLKYYEPKTLKMIVVGHVRVLKNQKIQHLIPTCKRLAGIPESASLLLYEEIKPGMIDLIKPEITFEAAEIVEGDIICFQNEFTMTEIDAFDDPTMATIPGYFDYLMNRIEIDFVPKSKGPHDNAAEEVRLTLSKKMNYQTVAQNLSKAISYDSEKIRFYQCANNRTSLIKRNPNLSLVEMLGASHYSDPTTTLMFELLEISVLEMETKRNVKVSVLDGSMKEEEVEVLVKKTGTIQDMVEALKEKVDLQDGELRVFETVLNKRHKVFKMEDYLSSMNGYANLYVERIPQEELDIAEGKVKGIVCECFHFSKETMHAHSIPFTFTIIPDEPLTETRQRLQVRSGIHKNDMARVKLALVYNNYSKKEYLEDGDVVLSNVDWNIAGGVMLGLDHVDKVGRAKIANASGGVKIHCKFSDEITCRTM